MCRIFALFLLTLLTCRGDVLVPGGPAADWKYLTSGPAAKNWQIADFDDASWASGKAPLGFGDRGLTTEITVPADRKSRPVTIWFRKTFDAPEAVEKPLVLSLRVDDGAAVYLNGREIARHNLPKDATAGTLATEPLSEPEESVFHRLSVPHGVILKGRNVLAVEVHQASQDSSDLWLDLSLATDSRQPEGTAKISEAARESTMAYFNNHYVPPGMKIADGYVDGGRRMVVGKDRVVLSSREILVIDRERDPALRKHLEAARDPELQKLPAAERARKLARYVDKALSPGGNRDASIAAIEEFTTEFANRPVLFGEMEAACQAGVCRHRSLLFKMLCDEAGLNAALVRGNYNNGRSGGGHAWNELMLDDGSRVIVDIMNPAPDFAFVPENSPEAGNYRSVKNEPVYPRSKAKADPGSK